MIDRIDWQADPIVVLEKRVHPLLHRTLGALRPEAAPDPELGAAIRAAAALVSAFEIETLAPHRVVLDAAARARVTAFARLLQTLAARLDAAGTGDPGGRAAVAGFVHAEMVPMVEPMLDGVRAAFIGTVLGRQRRAEERSEAAAREVGTISRQIYFISINASVEAARVGDAGRGFAVIGQQIRSLAQGADAALARLARAREAPR